MSDLEMSSPFRTEPFLTEEYARFIMPISRKNAWTMSRLAVLPDGSTMPVLRILALRKFGEYEEDERFAMWIDGNYHNEVMDNVILMDRKIEATKRRSSYGVPAGTPEYRRRYQAANKERVRAAQKRAYDKRKTLLKIAKATTEIAQGLGGAELLEGMQEQQDRQSLLERLAELAAADDAAVTKE